jgi:hypothetical protein
MPRSHDQAEPRSSLAGHLAAVRPRVRRAVAISRPDPMTGKGHARSGDVSSSAAGPSDRTGRRGELAPDDLGDPLVTHAQHLGDPRHREAAAVGVGRADRLVALAAQLLPRLLPGGLALSVLTGKAGELGLRVGGFARWSGDRGIVCLILASWLAETLRRTLFTAPGPGVDPASRRRILVILRIRQARWREDRCGNGAVRFGVHGAPKRLRGTPRGRRDAVSARGRRGEPRRARPRRPGPLAGGAPQSHCGAPARAPRGDL